MVLLKSIPGSLGSEIIDFSLKGIDGKVHSPSDYKDSGILIVIFMCNHCPYVKAVIGRFVKFQEAYLSKGVRLIGINSNDTDAYPDDSFENMILFSKERSMNFSYLIDDMQNIAKAYDAVCTPDIYVYDKERKLRYRGRYDDNWQDETKVKSVDLEKAVINLLNNEEINFEQIPSLGCSIKWKN